MKKPIINPQPNELPLVDKHFVLLPCGNLRTPAPFEFDGKLYAIRGYEKDKTYKHTVWNLKARVFKMMTADEFREYFLSVK